MKLTTPILILAFACATQADPINPNSLLSDSLSSPPPSAKDEATAYALAIGGTLVPFIPLIEAGIRGENSTSGTNSTPEFILSSIGFTFGPSLGQYYANSMPNGLWDCGIRAVGFGMIWAGGAYLGWAGEELGGLFIMPIITGDIIHSLIDTHYAVKRANEKAGAAHAAHFDLFPTLARSADGSERVGMMARVGF